MLSVNGISKEPTGLSVNGIEEFFATDGELWTNGQEHYEFFRRYGVSPDNLKLWLDQTAIKSGTSLATWLGLSPQANDHKQATASYQPSLSNTFMKDAARDFDGIDNYMHQKVYDTNQGNMTFVADGGSAEFRDDGQNFADWETLSGNAAYMIVITTNNGVSWAFCGASNNAGLDIDCYSDIALTTRGWKARTTPQATPDTAASYEILKTNCQITTALSVFQWVKPDDGQPGGGNLIFLSKWRTVDGFRSWAFVQLIDGKIRVSMSSDGAGNNEDEQTDAAFFVNGQETWHFIGFSWNGTICSIWGDGLALVSTTGVGGIPASLHDTSEKLTIGALSTPASYFAGLIGPTFGFSREVFADEVLRLFQTDRPRFM